MKKLIKKFINKYNWEETNYLSKIDNWKKFERNNPITALNILCIKEKKYFQLIFQNITQTIKNKIILLMIPNKEKEGWY